MAVPREAWVLHVVGYGCTTCIGNSGPLPEAIEPSRSSTRAISWRARCSAATGTSRAHSPLGQTLANYLASPPLVVAYALAGTVDIDLTQRPARTGYADGSPMSLLKRHLADAGRDQRCGVERGRDGPRVFQAHSTPTSSTATRPSGTPSTSGGAVPTSGTTHSSTYIQEPPFFTDHAAPSRAPDPTHRRVLGRTRACCMLGDSVTTDHISPAGAITLGFAGRAVPHRSTACRSPLDFNSFGSRRGNDRVMTRARSATSAFATNWRPARKAGARPCSAMVPAPAT